MSRSVLRQTVEADRAPLSGRGSQRAIETALPVGVIELARDRWRAADRQATLAGLSPTGATEAELIDRLGRELTAPLRLEDWPAPVEPRALAEGWIHDETVEADRSVLDALMSELQGSTAEVVAQSAQEMRLPVTPYRGLPHRSPVDRPSTTPRATERRPAGSPARPLVVDLSTHWAGPLTTALLAEAGAEVIKIDPACRPDGFRSRRALYRHLNDGKEVIDLDLRRPVDRERFEHLIGQASLLVESFSRRVLPNLGYDRTALARLNPSLATVSIKAFPATGPEAYWLAYGPGVHAASGLAMVGGRAAATPVAYPDLIAGVTAFASAVRLLAAGGGHGEVSLAGAIAPLVVRAIGTGSEDGAGRG